MNNAIGVFDSGVGGLTVAREIMRQLPNETIYYFGDVKNCPYGDKTKEEIIKNTDRAVKFLIDKGVKLVVLACNTVLVLGTKFTANSKVYDIEIENINSDIIVFDKACPAFVPFIESEGNLDKEATKNLISDTLGNTNTLGVDTVVLGCTHYPILKKDIEEYYGNNIKVISSGREAAREVSTVLGYAKLHQKKLNKKEHRFFISQESDNFDSIASKWLKKDINAEVVEI